MMEPHRTEDLTTEDDALHARSNDPWWTETVWFSWMVPERNLLGYFYPVLRPNLGIQFGGVSIIDPTGSLPWEIPVFDYSWHQQMPADLDLRDATFANGMWMRALDPTRTFDFGFENRDVSFALRFEAVAKALVTKRSGPFNNGHLDQLGHVTGTMKLRGEVIDVDCFAMRDRAWGPRQDGRQPKVGYAYAAASPDDAFLAISSGPEDLVSLGYLQRDGKWSPLVAGVRIAERDAEGRPIHVTIEARDELGRELRADGRPVAGQAALMYPSMFCWNQLVHWELDGNDAWGEDQDIWHPRKWRDRSRQPVETSHTVQQP